MSKNSDQRRDEFLGMSYSKASQQLTRKILLRLIQKCGQDQCFVCGEKIETVEELSIEHKKPWLHQSTELFWDLDNIAFSHRRCNRPHVYKGRGQTRKNLAEGLYWCSGCSTIKPKEDFHTNRTKSNGLATACKECVKERGKKRRLSPDYRKNWKDVKKQSASTPK